MKLLLGLLFLGNSLLIAAMDKAQKADLQSPSFDTLFRIIAKAQEKNAAKPAENNTTQQSDAKDPKQ
jgi:hypothetical protein